jgi:hypothetical protein
MSIWGVARPGITPAVLIPASDTSCPSATETTVITTSSALVAGFAGDFYPLIQGVLVILLGGTAPSALVIGARLGSAADFDSYTVEPALLTNSAELVIPLALVGVNSATAWSPTGAVVNITVNPTGQTVTCKKVGSRAIITLGTGPDA